MNYNKPYLMNSMSLSKRKRPLILDAGCGTGRSTYKLADTYPEALIIGIDKSESRLNQLKDYREAGKAITQIKKNALLMRADLISQWYLMAKNNWQFEKIYLLYPNPYPKKSRIKQRFYAHAIFPYLMKLSNQFEIRSNWKLYLEEFAIAAKLCNRFKIELDTLTPSIALTNFEEKYLNSKTELFQLQILFS